MKARPAPLPKHHSLQRLADSINGGYFAGTLPKLTVGFCRLPADRVAQFRSDLNEILIDPNRSPDVTGSLLHELAHAAVRDERDVHGPKFRAEHTKLRAWWQRLAPAPPARTRPPARPVAGPVVDDRREALQVLRAALQRLQDDYNHGARAPRKEPDPMDELPIRRTAAPREIRRPGALGIEQQLALIRQWKREHPSLCGIKGQKFQVIGGRVVPVYDDAPRQRTIAEKVRYMAARAARW